MPGMLCRCAESLRYGEIPNRIEWLVISDVEYDRFSGSVDAEELYRAMKSILKCPKCGRLWIFWEGFSQPPAEYVPVGGSTAAN